MSSKAKIEYHILGDNVKFNGKKFIRKPLENNIDLSSGIRIGFYGLTTPQTLNTTNPMFMRDYKFDSIESTSVAMIKEKRSKFDLLIALAHLGDSDKISDEEKSTFLRDYSKIDVIIDGHLHEEKFLPKEDDKPLLSRNNAFSNQFSEIEITKTNGIFKYNHKL
jgi:2',3'-cyclic-nucleotide 2'-phosphodiesterase (5'-nucleotidase family)